MVNIPGVSKTKVFASLWAIAAIAQSQGWIHLSPQCLETLQALLGTGVVFGVRDAIAKHGSPI